METVGEFFKRVRETKGLTIDEVAAKTRINPDFLKMLEIGNYSMLPDQVFAKGFVRSYASSLGLDKDDAIRRFVESAGTFYEKQIRIERLRLRQVEDNRRKNDSRKVVLSAIGVALLAMVLLFTQEQLPLVKDHPLIKQQPPKPFSSAAPPEANTLQTQSEQVEVPGPAVGLPRQAGSAGREPLELTLEALELSWVVVEADGRSPHEALLRPGERVTWTASDQFVLTLGNAGGVRVELNGVPQGPFGASGVVARGIVLKR